MICYLFRKKLKKITGFDFNFRQPDNCYPVIIQKLCFPGVSLLVY